MRTLETERLKLRPMGERDEDLYCRIYTDPGLMRHVGRALTREAALTAFANVCRLNRETEFRYRCWVVSHRESGENAGILGVVGNREQAEMGGMILPEWQGRGVSGETFPAGADFAFDEYKVNQVVVRYRASNVKMDGLMRKLPFLKVADQSCGDDWIQWMQTWKDWETRMRTKTENCRMHRNWGTDIHTAEDRCKQEA